MIASHLNPTAEFWNHMPPDVRRGVRQLAFGTLRLIQPMLDERTPEHDPIFLGQALYFALEESNQRLRDYANFPGRFSVERLQRISDWVRGFMDHCHQEGIFPGVFFYFYHALGYNTSEEIHRRLRERLPEPIMRNFEQSLAEIRSAGQIGLDSPEELVALGAILAKNLELTGLGVLRYAIGHGLLQREELASLPIRMEEVSNFQETMQRFHGIDTARLSPDHIRKLVERHRAIDEIFHRLEQDYGEVHPLIRGFSRGFFDGKEIDSRRESLETVLQLVEKYLAERH